MSVEIRAGWQCPHFVVEEPISLGTDRTSLKVRAPIANAGSVRILVNDQVYIPPTGLDSQASLTSSSVGPYKIERCSGLTGPDANILTVSTSSGTKSISLPIGTRVSLETIQRAIRLSEVNTLVIVSEENGALSLIERDTAGPESYIRVSGRGATALGFLQQGARGAHIYPGWVLAVRADVYPVIRNNIPVAPARYPKFTSPLKGNPTIKVSYSAMAERCPRCGGTWVENDWRHDPQGEVITISNEDLLYQACLKAILTVKGSNAFHTSYGSQITTRIGRKIVGAATALVKEDVTAALKQVQQLQQGQRSYQEVSNREVLYSVQTVNVRTSDIDPTVFFLDVTVRNNSNKAISLSTVFTVPGTIALAGTNGKPLGLEATGLSSSDASRLLLGS